MRNQEILCRQVRQRSEQIEDVVFRHLESRLAKALLLLLAERTADSQRTPGASIEIHVSQRELGLSAGGSRESVSKQLQQWRRRGLIDLIKGSIIIRNAAALERLI